MHAQGIHHRWWNWITTKVKHKKLSESIKLLTSYNEANVSNQSEWLNHLKDDRYYVSLLIKGIPLTLIPKHTWLGFKLLIEGLDLKSVDPSLRLYIRVLEERLQYLPKGWVLQGVLVSPLIPDDIYKNGTHFYVYNVMQDGKCLTPCEYGHVLKYLKIDTVPYFKLDLGTICIEEELQTYVDNLKFTPGCYHVGIDPQGSHPHKGIVIRNADNSLRFKIESKEYEDYYRTHHS